jgi:hypothetical protein
MTLKECHQWEEIDYIEATCPHCGVIDTHFGQPGIVGDVITCRNRKCKKKFKLGEQE